MSRPAPPVLTVRHDGSTRTFAAGNDVVIGRDLRADVRIAHPLISRAHLVLRFDQGRWIAIDNGSLNGMFVNGRRVPALDIQDGQNVNIGNPGRAAADVRGGPPHRVGGHARRRPQSVPVAHAVQHGLARPADRRRHGRWPPPSTSRPQPTYPSGPSSRQVPDGRPAAATPGRGWRSRSSHPSDRTVDLDRADAPRRARARRRNIATSMLKILRPGRSAEAPPGSIKIGRATDNDIVIPDVLASRHHATLVPTPSGTEIRDNRSINGTFVNGSRVESALLREGDVVTIGNVDLVFADGTLVRRTETEAATRTGGLDVHGVDLDHRGQQDAAGQHLVRRATGHAHRRHRPLGRRQVDLRQAGRRLHPSDRRAGHLRGPRHPRRVRLAAQPDRHGAAGRRGARPAHRQPGADVCRRAAAAAGHHQRGPRPGRRPGPRGAGDDPARRHPGRQAFRRSAQTRLGGDGAADRAVAADPRRTHLRSGSRAGPPGHDDAAPTGRRRPRRAGGDALADLPRRLRSGTAAGPRRQDRVLRPAERDRVVDGHHQLGRHLQLGRRRPRRGPPALPRPARPAAAAPQAASNPPTSASRRTPACGASSPRSRAARCG